MKERRYVVRGRVPLLWVAATQLGKWLVWNELAVVVVVVGYVEQHDAEAGFREPCGGQGPARTRADNGDVSDLRH